MDRNDCTSRVGVIGFCMGGGFALVVMPGKVSHSAYHEPSAHDARERIVAFFDDHLTAAP